jgi:hypothetical protein
VVADELDAALAVANFLRNGIAACGILDLRLVVDSGRIAATELIGSLRPTDSMSISLSPLPLRYW